MDSEPLRLRDDPTADAELRATLSAAREGPGGDDVRIERLAARLGPLMGPGGGGPGGEGPGGEGPGGDSSAGPSGAGAGGVGAAGVKGVVAAGKGLLATKGVLLAAATAVTVGASGLAWWALSAPAPTPIASLADAGTASLVIVQGAAPSSESIPDDGDDVQDTGDPAPNLPPRGRLRPPSTRSPMLHAPSTPTAESPVTNEPVAAPDTPRGPDTPSVPDSTPTELELVRTAMRALATSPAAALEATELHATRFPRGAMSDEREVIAIDALMRLGRRDEAHARAARFRAMRSDSPSLRRLDRILAREP